MQSKWMSTVAGVLQIVAGVCGLIGAGLLAFACLVVTTVPEIGPDDEIPIMIATSLLTGLGLFSLLFALVAILGGIFALRRRGWAWALSGAIAALFLVLPLGIASLVLTILGEREFDSRELSVEG